MSKETWERTVPESEQRLSLPGTAQQAAVRVEA